LVGSNGAGKSTLLDAVLIGASAATLDAIGRVAVRRAGLADPGKWLFTHSPSEPMEAVVSVHSRAWSEARTIALTTVEPADSTSREISVELRGGRSTGFLGGGYGGGGRPDTHLGRVTITGRKYTTHEAERSTGGLWVRLVEPGDLGGGEPLSSVRRRAREFGRHGLVRDLAATLITGLRDVSVEDAGDARATLYLDYGSYILPEAVAGDGVRALLRAAYELAAAPGGVVLLEEPEVHLHPGAMRLCARAIHATAQRDVQVILSTHSIEFIDCLIAGAEDDAARDRLSVHRVRLEDGVMHHRVIGGAEAVFLRGEIEEDLR